MPGQEASQESVLDFIGASCDATVDHFGKFDDMREFAYSDHFPIFLDLKFGVPDVSKLFGCKHLPRGMHLKVGKSEQA
eukprot:8398281-Karenia_brevis.AAC.1